jgi:hypothetical protein
VLSQIPKDELLALPKYDRIAIYLFRQLTANYTAATLPAQLEFDLQDVRQAMRRAVADGLIKDEIKNIADIKYTYDARRELPSEIEQCGPMTWLQNGKGRYKLRRTRRPNIIDFATLLPAAPHIEFEVDQTPPFIASLLGTDEQAVFTRVRNVDLISKVLGFKVWPIQGHARTTVTYGQIEIDEVQAGLDKGVGTIVPISGKGGDDKLSWSQALNLNTYAAQKPPKQGLKVRSVGLWRDHENTVWIVEFSPHTDIDQIEIVSVRRFKFQ